MRRVIGFALALLGVLGLFSCGDEAENPMLMAPGSYGDVAIVVSDPALSASLPAFKESFNEEFTFVIAREPLFQIDEYPPEKWELCKTYKNILFVWRVGDGGPVEKYLRGLLDDDAEARLNTAAGVVHTVVDPFANFQFAVIVAGTDRNGLLSFLRRQAPALRASFEEQSAARIRRRYRQEGLATELMSDLWIQCRFFLEIPAEFKLNQMTPDGYPAVELMQTGPSRGLTVGWSQSSDPELLLTHPGLLLELRKEMGLKMHQEVVVPEFLVWKTDVIGELPAVRLEGAWDGRNFEGGGPFWCWFVADPEGQRVFCLDALCYAPGRDKLDYFRRMRAILQTFSLTRPQP
ncbi:MAG TPA: DUF4837 family protein [Candidatus Krumholzibacteria bacterium]|nr:DUF4837 family protein [Candidatus Krumholzibacteria bacterium]HPD71498.1 DUF4837 family protein [Candidatus Krumholzibacteria bacterium]HRY41569.1 DUF4837 family protein [Candidatus Krumholzibacteria bacterium]